MEYNIDGLNTVVGECSLTKAEGDEKIDSAQSNVVRVDKSNIIYDRGEYVNIIIQVTEANAPYNGGYGSLNLVSTKVSDYNYSLLRHLSSVMVTQNKKVGEYTNVNVIIRMCHTSLL